MKMTSWAANLVCVVVVGVAGGGCIAEYEEEGVDTDGAAIINGTPVDALWPRAVRISSPSGSCSGTLIQKLWVLSAAHCGRDWNPSDVTVTYRNAPAPDETVGVTHIIRHPGDLAPGGSVAINLMRLADPLEGLSLFENGEVPLSHADTDTFLGSTATLYGYGGTFDLRRGDFTVTADPNNDDVYFRFATPNALGQSPTNGDSGGGVWLGPFLIGVNTGEEKISGEAFAQWVERRRDCPVYDPNDPPNSGYCSAACPCGAGEGDCDSDSQCEVGLACISNNGAQYGLPSHYDVCAAPPSCPAFDASSPDPSFCSDPACPCGVGEGDCDDNTECGGIQICRHDVGAAVGLPTNWDVCEYPTAPGCPALDLDNPNTGHCTTACPCGLGAGDCDSDAQCRGDLRCGHDNGASFGLPSNYDVCVR